MLDGVAGIVAIVLATYGASWGLGAGLVLSLLVEIQRIFNKQPVISPTTLEPEVSEAA